MAMWGGLVAAPSLGVVWQSAGRPCCQRFVTSFIWSSLALLSSILDLPGLQGASPGLKYGPYVRESRWLVLGL